ncbi:MAG TPA: preprotein translocase subunit SecG [Vicinamibacterales bacterium]|nr:preprotein translocase subunit SecG [Vicinamibacterales bacterium]
MHTVLVVVQVVVAIAVIGLILLQQGKGADAGAAFGSGASGTVFGSRGAANFLSRATAVLATVFFLVSLSLAYLVSNRTFRSESVIEQQLGAKPAPAQPAPGPAVPEVIMPLSPSTGDSQEPKKPAVPE